MKELSPDTLVIRADATGVMGGGHVIRCLALALEWQRTGGKVWFVGHITSETLRAHVEAAVYRFLPVSEDAGSAVEVLRHNGVARCWAVVDGYHFDDAVFQAFEQAGWPVLLLHDGPELVKRPVSAILAQDVQGEPADLDKVERPLILAGGQYRLLRPEFSGQLARPKMAPDQATVLIMFGAADRYNRTTEVLMCLSGVLRPKDTVVVVLGPLNTHEDSVRARLSELPFSTELYRDVRDMVSLYRRSDLAVSASGGAAWEMAATGLPAILVTVAENQKASAGFLQRAGAAVSVDLKALQPGGQLPEVVADLLSNPEKSQAMSLAGPEICDGMGVYRVCTAIRNSTSVEPKNV